MKWLLALAIFAIGIYFGFESWGLIGGLIAFAVCVVIGLLMKAIFWFTIIGALLSEIDRDH